MPHMDFSFHSFTPAGLRPAGPASLASPLESVESPTRHTRRPAAPAGPRLSPVTFENTQSFGYHFSTHTQRIPDYRLQAYTPCTPGPPGPRPPLTDAEWGHGLRPPRRWALPAGTGPALL